MPENAFPLSRTEFVHTHYAPAYPEFTEDLRRVEVPYPLDVLAEHNPLVAQNLKWLRAGEFGRRTNGGRDPLVVCLTSLVGRLADELANRRQGDPCGK